VSIFKKLFGIEFNFTKLIGNINMFNTTNNYNYNFDFSDPKIARAFGEGLGNKTVVLTEKDINSVAEKIAAAVKQQDTETIDNAPQIAEK